MGLNSSLIAGLDWVATVGAHLPVRVRVVNMSLSGVAACGDVDNSDGSIPSSTFLQTAVTNVRNEGVALFAAAGNADALGNVESASLHFPANCDGVMAVASSTAQSVTVPKQNCASPIEGDSASRWSNNLDVQYFALDNGAKRGVSAPGQRQENYIRGCAFVTTVGITSLKRGGGTFEAFGTSMATPHVAGLAALLFQNCANATPAIVEAAIQDGAADVSGPLQWSLSHDDGVDEGIANLYGAQNHFTCPTN